MSCPTFNGVTTVVVSMGVVVRGMLVKRVTVFSEIDDAASEERRRARGYAISADLATFTGARGWSCRKIPKGVFQLCHPRGGRRSMRRQ